MFFSTNVFVKKLLKIPEDKSGFPWKNDKSANFLWELIFFELIFKRREEATKKKKRDWRSLADRIKRFLQKKIFVVCALLLWDN